MEISPIFFYLFAGVALAASAMVILKRNPVASAFSLVMVFFAFAGIYALLDAHLIAAIQILVYAGAIMVLFLFVIMLLSADVPSFDLRRAHPVARAVGGVLSLVLFGFFVWAFKNSPSPAPLGNFTAENIEAAGGNSRVLSELMFSEYILPFELTSVLLLAAIIGAVAIAKRKQSLPTEGRRK
ncbi:MAG: NADH-quinone oxidoreductase subunit J [Oligoflexia bacterium]|nr:NADH-quinone oxidoreductase subunit J [Oligoflexia bacterium]